MYSRDLIDQILKSADIVTVISSYITVTKKGRSYVALCPFHDDKNPSLNISKDKQIFKCFSCGTGGNAITFVEKYEKIPFEEAVRKVADIIGFHDERLTKEAYKVYVDPSLTPLYNCIDDLEKYYEYALSIQEGEKARNYLANRHISDEEIAKYGLGYAPLDGEKTVQYLLAKGHSLKSIEDIGISTVGMGKMSDVNAGRLIFSIRDSEGRVVGFSARQLQKDGSPKYVNTRETPLFKKGEVIYNYHNAKKTAHHDGFIYLLEGFMDVMALDKAGLSSAIALMGTALTDSQIKLLRKLGSEVRLCLDGDAPGQEGMMKMIFQLNKAAMSFRLVSNPGDLRDPDDILQESGPEALKESMSHLVDAFDFQIDYYTNVKKLDSPDDKRKVMMYFIPFLRNMEPGIDRDNYVVKLAKATSYEPEAIKAQINVTSKEIQTDEETMSIDEIEFTNLHPGQLLVKRLLKAERETLYYMLENMDAVKYFTENVDSFYYPIYNEIANYVIQYTEERKERVNVSALLADIAGSGNKDADELESKLSEIAEDSYHPPYSEKAISDCAQAIRQEKDKISDESMTKDSMMGKTDQEKAQIITEFAARRKERLRSRYRKK